MEVCKLNYKKFGDTGTVVVILHGLFGMLDNWKSFARQLSQTNQVYVVDLRNHGKSCHLPEMHYEVMAEDLKAFCLEHNLSEMNLVGHSMGGKVAMYFATYYPDFVDRLVVVDIAPKSYKPSHNAIFEALMEIDLEQDWTRNKIQEQLAKKIPFVAVLQFLMKNLKRGENSYSWKFNLQVIWKNYDQILGQPSFKRIFEQPTLFIKGGNSAYILKTDKEDILVHFPEATFVEIDNAGHWVHAEKPKEVQRLLNRFFNS